MKNDTFHLLINLVSQDSLWAAEDIEAVFDQDPQRVCILQGPIAAKHCKVVDEPIAELLGGIEKDLARRILERYYGGDESKIPLIDYIGSTPAAIPSSLPGVTVTTSSSSTTYKIGSTVPSTSAWLETLAGPEVGWLRAALTTTTIIQGAAYIDNPLKRLFAPRKGQEVIVSSQGGVPVSVVIKGGARSHGVHKADFKALEVTYNKATKAIDITIFEDRRDVAVPLSLSFVYRPEMGYAPIHEIADGRNTRIKAFYWKLWYGDDESLPQIDLRETFVGPEVTIDGAAVERFCAVVGNQGESFKATRSTDMQAPMDFAIVTGWQVCNLLTLLT